METVFPGHFFALLLIVQLSSLVVINRCMHECRFGTRRDKIIKTIKIESKANNWALPSLGFIVHMEWQIKEDDRNRIATSSLKWRNASGVLYDCRIPIKSKGKFYPTAIRYPCFSVLSVRQWKNMSIGLSAAKMNRLRWMRDKTRKEKIRNEDIRELQ